MTTTTDLRRAVERVLPGVREDLDALVRIPSVSADPARARDVLRSAEATADLLRAAGSGDVRVIVAGGGAPAVVARWPAPDATPTVLLYAHHDVQPTGPPQAWASAPFEPTERSGRLYGRGAADDKAGVAAHLAALRAWDGRPPLGVTVLVEGEEEIGSPTLAALLAEHHDLLACDVMVLADSTNWAVGRPALTRSLRGLADCVVEVRTLEHAVHSGLYGGAVPDALTALCRLLATLHDEAGDVAVAGLVTGVADPLDLTEARLRADAGVLPGVDLVGTGALTERLWARPAIAVLGIDATGVDNASNTLAAAVRAKVSLRVAPGDDAGRALRALAEHLRAHAPWGAQVLVEEGATAAPYTGGGTDGWAEAAARRAFAEAWDEPLVDIGIGGSIPFVAAFAEAFPDAAILVTGVEDPDSRAHGADESLHLGDFARVCLAETLLLAELARGA